jgi:glutamate dehydrogenase (NADP+)
MEVMEGIFPFVKANPKYDKNEVLEKFVVPERSIIFRVPWVDHKGEF